MLYLKTLKLNKEFKRVYYNSAYKAHPLVVTYLSRNRQKCGRYGIATPKKIGNAVKRNRAKRLITAALINLEKEFNLVGYDIVFLARVDTPSADFHQLSNTIRNHLRLLLTQKPQKSSTKNKNNQK